jgi:hypothetical protein
VYKLKHVINWFILFVIITIEPVFLANTAPNMFPIIILIVPILISFRRKSQQNFSVVTILIKPKHPLMSDIKKFFSGIAK